jgi:Cu/Ag efflux pump CusA
VPLGVAVISGLLVASTMTLFLVPVLYTLFERPRAGRESSPSGAKPD